MIQYENSDRNLINQNNNGAENMLKAVDTVGSALRRSIESGNDTSATIITTNVVLEVKKIGKENVEFPAKSASENATDVNKDWIYKSSSKLTLDNKVFKGTR